MRIFWILPTAIWLIAAMTSAVHADPISAAIVGILGISGTFLGTVVGIAINIGIAVGLSYLAQALMPKAQQSTVGLSGEMQAGGTIDRSFVVGKGATGGSLVYVNTFGTDGDYKNAFLVQVIALSDLPIEALTNIWVYDAKVTWNPNGTMLNNGIAIPEYRKDDKNHLWVRFYDGTQTAASSFLTEKFAGDTVYPWTNSMIGAGVAYVVITARINKDLYSGFPTFKFEVKGLKLYDIRKDSTAGGVGSHRWSNPSTWEWTDNPVVILYNLLRGISYQGKWFYGLQTVTAPRLPYSSWVPAMNECDVEIALAGGGTEKQYRAGGEIPISAEPGVAIDELLKACNGRLSEIGGTYKISVGAAGSAVMSFSDDDILTTSKQKFTPFPPLDETVNGITAKYPNPEEAWAQKDAPPRYNAVYEQQDDGRRLVADVSYNMVSSGTQVQRLMESALREARRWRHHQIPLPPSAFPLEPGDIVSFSSTRNGYIAKPFRVVAVQDQGNLDVVIDILEIDHDDYDWVASTDERPTSSAPLIILPPAPQPMVDWFAIGVLIFGDGGRARAGIRLTWEKNQDGVSGVQFEVVLASDETVVVLTGETARWEMGAIDISANIIANSAYRVRGRYIPSSPRETVWSDFITVTTPDVQDGLSNQQLFELGLTTSDARESMQAIRAEIRDLVETLAMSGAESLGDMFIQDGRIESRVAAVSGAISAAVIQVTEAYLTADAAIASSLTAVEAMANSATAGGFVKLEAMATPDGSQARFQVYLNVGTEGAADWKEAGFMLDIVDGEARCFFNVDKMVIGNSTNGIIPFSVQDDRVIMREVTIQTSDDVIKLDLRNNSLVFSEPGP